ncbi:MAG: hypothetical protein JWN30_545 [Bacilli bacterium]|nr:hypothetical protein [Bacilli bacterium]
MRRKGADELTEHSYQAPIQILFDKLAAFNQEVTFQQYADRIVQITSSYEDIAFPVAAIIAYISFLPNLFSETRPAMDDVFRLQPAPFTDDQIELIFEDLEEEDLTGEPVIEYLVDVLRDVAEEMKKNLN